MADEKAEATVRRVWAETPRLQGVVLEVSPEVAARYTSPGQVITMHPAEGKPIYIALASSPGEAQAFEVLLGETAAAALNLKEGGTVTVGMPMGKGYPLDMAAGKDVLLFAVGSALAPLRPVVETFRRSRSDYGRVVLYMGAHTESDFPYQKEYEAWSRDRIDVITTMSKPWVQDVFKKDPPELDNAVAYVCGMKDMMTDVQKVLEDAGLPSEKIGKNW